LPIFYIKTFQDSCFVLAQLALTLMIVAVTEVSRTIGKLNDCYGRNSILVLIIIYCYRHLYGKLIMQARKLLQILRERGCIELRQKGSHIRIKCKHCFSTVPNHNAEDLRLGTLRQIQKDLEPCLGREWLKKI